jgi:Pentapeptide repeats (8 copies)
LSGADLSETDLSGTDLSGANLHGAKGVTILELERQAKSLQDATMHEGRKYEDWGENRGAASRKGRTPVLYSCS